jgi:hypothetical protein
MLVWSSSVYTSLLRAGGNSSLRLLHLSMNSQANPSVGKDTEGDRINISRNLSKEFAAVCAQGLYVDNNNEPSLKIFQKHPTIAVKTPMARPVLFCRHTPHKSMNILSSMIGLLTASPSFTYSCSGRNFEFRFLVTVQKVRNQNIVLATDQNSATHNQNHKNSLI